MISAPIIVLGAPRSGTTILQRCLSMHPQLWHLPAESHAILEGPLHPALTGYESNRVLADQVDESVMEYLRAEFYSRAINLNAILADPSSLAAEERTGGRVLRRLAVAVVGFGSQFRKPRVIRFLEKTPKNALRIPFLARLFPDALFVWIRRDVATNVDSLIAGWHAVDRLGPITLARFARAGYPIAHELELKDYSGKWWKFALVPEWREFKGKTVADVALWQCFQCNKFILSDLAELDNRRVLSLKYEDFIREPVRFVRQIFEWAGLAPSSLAERFANELPRVNDATPGFDRKAKRLRFPEAVHAAMERLPAIADLQSALGYSGN